MYKCFAVVALVLLVLTGAMGLRNTVAANAVTMSSSMNAAPSIWANGGGPYPPIPTSGGHVWANGGGPYPPIPTGGGHVWANGGGPYPPIPTGGGHVQANGSGSGN